MPVGRAVRGARGARWGRAVRGGAGNAQDEAACSSRCRGRKRCVACGVQPVSRARRVAWHVASRAWRSRFTSTRAIQKPISDHPWTTWGTLSFSDENQPSEELTTQSTFGGLKGPVRTGRSARSPPVVRTSCVVMRLGRAYYRVHAISFVE